MPSLTWIIILAGGGYIGGRFGEAIAKFVWAQYKAYKHRKDPAGP
jgi:hypothetical protein